MSDPAALNNSNENFDNMTAAEFEERLPDLIAISQGTFTDDPRFTVFFDRNPDCAALVRDLEAIAKAARDLFPMDEPGEAPEESTGSDRIWENISNQLKNEPNLMDGPNGIFE
jgi:hypothetical protein